MKFSIRHSRKKWMTYTAVFAIACMIALTGCGQGNSSEGAASPSSQPPSASSESPSSSPSASGQGLKIGMVTDTGGVNDNSFNQSSWEGLQQLSQETGIEVKYLQSKADSDYLPNLNQFAKQNYDLTWGIGYIIADSMKLSAEQNKDARFAIIDNVVEMPNIQSVTFAEHEGSFLVGVVAGLTTQSNKVGFIGGLEIPVIKRFEAGFKAGVAAVNPNATVSVNYTGAFDKPDLGKAAAATLYNDGVDILFHAAGSTGNGAFNEAKDRVKNGQKVWMIGVDKDQSLIFGNEVTLTSMVKRVDEAVKLVSKSVIDGTFQGGTVLSLGLKDNGVGLPADNPNLSQEVLDKVEEYKAKIVSGEIEVPTE
ncbi:MULTISPECIES: BMP family protein [unclassified Cohnella]|uniref:BMP family lipoprotein n=1 Tax=unclassified Cohnella TaxID=2636738 RepID=UPI001E56E940|nr:MULTISPECIES: BMP family ABC transporter substrate-binding protein [unclassified Cohnella]